MTTVAPPVIEIVVDTIEGTEIDKAHLICHCVFQQLIFLGCILTACSLKPPVGVLELAMDTDTRCDLCFHANENPCGVCGCE
jgi:hypothetical protein